MNVQVTLDCMHGRMHTRTNTPTHLSRAGSAVSGLFVGATQLAPHALPHTFPEAQDPAKQSDPVVATSKNMLLSELCGSQSLHASIKAHKYPQMHHWKFIIKAPALQIVTVPARQPHMFAQCDIRVVA